MHYLSAYVFLSSFLSCVLSQISGDPAESREGGLRNQSIKHISIHYVIHIDSQEFSCVSFNNKIQSTAVIYLQEPECRSVQKSNQSNPLPVWTCLQNVKEHNKQFHCMPLEPEENPKGYSVLVKSDT